MALFRSMVHTADREDSQMLTEEEFRRLALEVEGASEDGHMGHADFRIGTRIFATLGHPRPGFAVAKLTPEQQRMATDADPEIFAPVIGSWGLKGATLITLAEADAESVRSALGMAVSNVERILNPRRTGRR
jgi:hypothetical protein